MLQYYCILLLYFLHFFPWQSANSSLLQRLQMLQTDSKDKWYLKWILQWYKSMKYVLSSFKLNLWNSVCNLSDTNFFNISEPSTAEKEISEAVAKCAETFRHNWCQNVVIRFAHETIAKIRKAYTDLVTETNDPGSIIDSSILGNCNHCHKKCRQQCGTTFPCRNACGPSRVCKCQSQEIECDCPRQASYF